MLAASRADALAKAAGHAARPAPAVAHRAAAARPGHSSPGRPARRPAPAEQALRDRLGGRRLLLLWPRAGRPPHAPSPTSERDWLAAWCRRHDAVLGVREGAVDRAGSHTQTLTPCGAWSLSARNVPDPSVVLRVADVVLTDDADETVDFLLTGRPLLHLLPGRPLDPTSCSTTIRPRRPCRARSVRRSRSSRPRSSGRSRPRRPRAVAAYRAGGRAGVRTHRRPVGWRVVERIRRQYVDG